MKNNYNLYLERPVNPERYRLIRKFGEGRYLDVGCGNGKYLSQMKIDGLPFKCFSGVDHQSFESWEEIDAEFEVSDVHTLPYSDGQFDTVSCFELLEHVERPSDVIRELRRVCSGRLIITVPNCDIPKILKDNGLTFYSYTDRTHIQFFTLSTLVELVETGGFKIVESGFINEVGLRNLMLSALLFEGVKGRLSKSYIKKCGMDELYMTLYVVAEIEGADFGS